MNRDEKFRRAAAGYAAYGTVYWLGGLALLAAGAGPRPPVWVVTLLLVTSAALIVAIPWLLWRDRPWFDRWILSRRDFARILTLFVAWRAVEVGRIAWREPQPELLSLAGFGIPLRVGAWAFSLMTVAMAILLAHAAWSRER
jgi:hypothetical protein